MIQFDFKKFCTGCGGCIDICPRHCIMPIINHGFMIPNINKEQCINCGLCNKVCPVINSQTNNKQINILYAAYSMNKHIRKKSSSGGIFASFAKHIIKLGGKVYACTFDQLKCKHIAISTEDDIIKCIGSKYVQSDTKNIYKSIKSDLSNNTLVLFVGTPCQCNALLNFVGNNRDKLYVIDFICHGVCSQELFTRSVHLFEKKNNCKIIDFSFRYKTKESLRNFRAKYVKNNSIKSIIKSPTEFPFYNSFLNHYTFRNSCYECQYKTITRVSDITLGDFWNIEKYRKFAHDYKLGYSAVIINSTKGNFLFSEVKPDIFYKKTNINYLIGNNFALTKKDKRPLLRTVYGCIYKCNIKIITDLILTNNPSFVSRLIRTLCNKIDLIKLKI